MSDNIDDEDQAIPPASDITQKMEQQIDTIILAEADNTTPGDERGATHGRHPSVASNLAPGFLNAVAKCDHIVSLAPQLLPSSRNDDHYRTGSTMGIEEDWHTPGCLKGPMDGRKTSTRPTST